MGGSGVLRVPAAVHRWASYFSIFGCAKRSFGVWGWWFSIIPLIHATQQDAQTEHTHKAYFPTPLIYSPTDLFCYDYYCYFISSYLWITCYLSTKSVYGTDTLNVSHITSNILIAAKSVIIEVQNNISYATCKYVYDLHQCHISHASLQLFILYRPRKCKLETSARLPCCWFIFDKIIKENYFSKIYFHTEQCC
jgi:hypothetical protein